jgi:hypothetical protein
VRDDSSFPQGGQPDERRGMSSANHSDATACVPGFVLLFSAPLLPGFSGFASRHEGFTPTPEAARTALDQWRSAAQAHVLGAAFIQAARLARYPLGRLDLGAAPVPEPRYAEVSLLAHVFGVALWEVWMPAPRQAFDVARWVAWLDPDRADGVAERVWRRLSAISRDVAGTPDFSAYLPLSVIRLPATDLDGWLNEHAQQAVSLLWRDRMERPLKPEVVADELARDSCARVGGITLIGRRSALDLHDRHDESAAEAEALELPPRSALPFLITLELLCVERGVLQSLYDRLAHAGPHSIDALVALKQDVVNGLEEYYGATLASTRFNDLVAKAGEEVLGIVDLFDAVTDRLDMVSFTLTTSYQRRMTLLQFWLTVVFGATEIGFIAASIATWYYRSGLGTVLAWTLGAAALSGVILVALLRSKIE